MVSSEGMEKRCSEEGHVKMEAGNGVLLLQAKEDQDWEGPWSLWRVHGLADTAILYFWPLDLWRKLISIVLSQVCDYLLEQP